jgi:hypothetical protein
VHIDWGTFAEIAVVAAAATVTVVLLMAFALVGLSPRSARQVGALTPGARPALGLAVATLCLVAAGLIVAYGLYLIIA